MADFVIPEFLQNCDVDIIHAKGLAVLPADIDRSEAGFAWDFTRPTALLVAELCQFYIPETIKLIFPEWSYGEYLDYHAARSQITRKAATYATATLTITGTPGTEIPKGTLFATVAKNSRASIEFAADRLYTIDEAGTCTVSATATTAGASGNVKANTIVLMASPIRGVETVTNTDAASGGTEKEDDKSLRARIHLADTTADQSYIGNNADYKRWAESVDGMGTATVIPTWDGAGTVKIVCMDGNGEPAAQSILDAVYNYIMSPDDELSRLAPPDVVLTVVAPSLVTINYEATLYLASGNTLEMVRTAFSAAMEEYYKTAASSGSVKYGMVASILAGIPGVSDFTGLTINGTAGGVTLAAGEYPRTGTVFSST